MKKKLVIFSLLVTLLVAMFSMSMVGAYAEESANTEGWKVQVVGLTDVKEGTDYLKIAKGAKTTVTYKLTYNGVEVKQLVDDVNGFTYAPIVAITSENASFKATGAVVDATSLAKGDYTVKLAVKQNDGTEIAPPVTFVIKVAAAKKNYSTYIMLGVAALLLIGIFAYSSYSNKKRQKKALATQTALEIGDKVKTIGGVCGYVVEINDEEGTFVLETGTADNKTYTKFDKAAIYQTAKPESEVQQPAEEVVEEPAKEEPADKE